jgi:hypothetical protein
MKTIATASLVSQDTHNRPMYQQAFHGMEFAIGSPIGTCHNTPNTMVTTNDDFLKTSSVLETN